MTYWGDATEHARSERARSEVAEVDRAVVGSSEDGKANVLQEAAEIVLGDRMESYGAPGPMFECLAKITSAYIDYIHSTGQELQGHHMCVINGFQKSVRDVKKHKRDNLRDKGGYVLCEELCREYQSENAGRGNAEETPKA